MQNFPQCAVEFIVTGHDMCGNNDTKDGTAREMEAFCCRGLRLNVLQALLYELHGCCIFNKSKARPAKRLRLTLL